MLNCISSVLIDSGLNFLAAEHIPPAHFWRKQLKTQFFQRASVTLSPFSGSKSHVWHPKTSQAKDFEPSVAFSFYQKLF